MVREADMDGSASLSFDEFKKAVLSARRTHEDPALAETIECVCQVENAFHIVDANGDGAVTEAEVASLLADDELRAGVTARRSLVAAKETSYYAYTTLKAEKKVLATEPDAECKSWCARAAPDPKLGNPDPNDTPYMQNWQTLRESEAGRGVFNGMIGSFGAVNIRACFEAKLEFML